MEKTLGFSKWWISRVLEKVIFSLFLCNSKSQSLGLICGLVNVVFVVNVCVVYLIIDVFGRKGSEAKPNQIWWRKQKWICTCFDMCVEMEAWAFEQHLGERVSIHIGCPHQVHNMKVGFGQNCNFEVFWRFSLVNPYWEAQSIFSHNGCLHDAIFY